MQLSHILGALALVGFAIFYMSGREFNLPTPGADGSIFGIPVSTRMGGTKFDPARPETARSQEVLGEKLISPGLALAGREVRLAGDALSFFEPTRIDEVPAEVFTLPDMQGCDFRRPRPDEAIGNVHVSGGTRPTAVLAASRDDVARWALDWVKAQKNGKGDASLTIGVQGAALRSIDVVVTETAKPVYLILQSRWGGVLWNVQKAPEVAIAHIAIIAGGPVGLVNPDSAVPVEILQIWRNPGCAARPVLRPDETWELWKRTDQNNQDQTWKEHLDRYEGYNAFFRSRFGFSSDQGLIGYLEASHVLVGPMPEQYNKVPQVRLAGARVGVATNDHVLSGLPEAIAAGAADLIAEVALAATGGRMANLNPEPVHRAE